VAAWTHTYRETEIPEGGVIKRTDGGGHMPGRLIAKAITEIHERAINDVAPLETTGGITGEAYIDNGTLIISLDASNVSGSGNTEVGFVIPSGGQPGMVLTLRVSSSGQRTAVWDWVRAVDVTG
jgi:hypothetical protein